MVSNFSHNIEMKHFFLVIFFFMFMEYSQRPPILQSVWYIPHVTAYAISYLLLIGAFICAVSELAHHVNLLKSKKSTKISTGKICDLLVHFGTISFGFGICFGALWAKKSWGEYWSWDIKETAALITWSIFLLFIHLQKFTKIKRNFLLFILIIGFLSLQFTWYGVNFMKIAKKSPHTFYNLQR